MGDPSAAAPGANFEFGVDPSLDPELAMVRTHTLSRWDNLTVAWPQALRMSLEEEQARQAAAAQTSGAASGSTAPAAPAETPSSAAAPATPAPAPVASVPADPTDDEEEAMLKQALAMSEGRDVDMAPAGDEEMSEEDEIAKAIAMSMQQQEEDKHKDKK